MNMLDRMDLVQGKVIDTVPACGVLCCVAVMAWLQVTFKVFDFPFCFLAVPVIGTTIGLIVKAMGWKSTSIIRSMLWTSVVSLIVIVFILMLGTM